MEAQNRYDFFEPGDLTALVCVDQPEIQKAIIEQLTALDYKLHTGMFLDDVLLKVKAHNYDIVVIDENFNGSLLDSSPLLAEIMRLPANTRRSMFVVLVGLGFTTNDEMQAFGLSVNLVCNVADIKNLRPVLRRGISRNKEFYASLTETLKMMA
jgi:hypothetical protein